MGYYIETPQPLNKVNQLRIEFPTIKILEHPTYTTDKDGATVCVVDNGHFQAVAVIFSKDEFEDFNYVKDYRPKTWLNVPKSVIENLVAQSRCPAPVLNYLK